MPRRKRNRSRYGRVLQPVEHAFHPCPREAADVRFPAPRERLARRRRRRDVGAFADARNRPPASRERIVRLGDGDERDAELRRERPHTRQPFAFDEFAPFDACGQLIGKLHV